MPHKTAEARAAYHKMYRQKNANHLIEKSKQWREANQETVKAGHLRHYQENKQVYKDRANAIPYWQKKFYRALGKARRASAEIIGMPSIREYYRQVFSRGSEVCFYCRGRFPIEDITIDHKQPYALGGQHMVSNFEVSCNSCNVKKHTTPFEAWVALG